MRSIAVDAEQSCTTRFLIQNADVNIATGFISQAGTGGDYVTFCLRGSPNCRLETEYLFSLDADSASLYSRIEGNRYQFASPNFSTSKGVGVGFGKVGQSGGANGRAARYRGEIRMNGFYQADVYVNTDTSAIEAGSGFQMVPQTINSGTFPIAVGTGNVFEISVSGSSITLPAISTYMGGYPFYVSNPFSAPATVLTSSGNLIDGVTGVTGFTIGPNCSMLIIAHNPGGALTPYWGLHGSPLKSNSILLKSAASGSILVPAWSSHVVLEAGGSGAGGNGSSSSNGIGGAGGGYGKSIVPVTPGQQIWYSIGSGGLGGNIAGSAGNPSWWNIVSNAAPTLATQGVEAGGGAANTSSTAGAAGGLLVGQSGFTGGIGGVQGGTSGGGGGGGGGSNGNGGAGQNGSGSTGGPGGFGGLPDGGLGGAGVAIAPGANGAGPGGGGGSAYSSGAGGAGADGWVKATFLV